jgi:formamidopyrimidine-DNA glycosylase
VPELPDVEKHRRTIAEHAVGKEVRRVEVRDPDLLEGTSPQGLGRAAVGRVVAEPHRHGKWLLAPLDADGPALLFHFRMTGELVWLPDGGLGPNDAVAPRCTSRTARSATAPVVGSAGSPTSAPASLPRPSPARSGPTPTASTATGSATRCVAREAP